MSTLRRLATAVGLVLALASGVTSEAAAEERAIDEYQVKAAYLYNFAKFVEWPPESFKVGGGRISICIAGNNPFGSLLADAVRDKVVAGRGFEIRPVKGAGEAASCHILFISDSEQKQLTLLLSPLQGSQTLTVGESDDFLAKGGLIQFKLKDSHVRLEINLAGAARAKCHISSKLLALSEVAEK